MRGRVVRRWQVYFLQRGDGSDCCTKWGHLCCAHLWWRSESESATRSTTSTDTISAESITSGSGSSACAFELDVSAGRCHCSRSSQVRQREPG